MGFTDQMTQPTVSKHWRNVQTITGKQLGYWQLILYYFTFHFCYYCRWFLPYIIHWANLSVIAYIPTVFGRLNCRTGSWWCGVILSWREATGTHWQWRCVFSLEWSWLRDQRLMHGGVWGAAYSDSLARTKCRQLEHQWVIFRYFS